MHQLAATVLFAVLLGAQPGQLPQPAPLAPRSVETPDQTGNLTAELQSTLDGMAEAALAGNADAYMKFVATHDSEFVHEQRYFANDLAKKPPATIGWRIVLPVTEDVQPGSGEQGKPSDAAEAKPQTKPSTARPPRIIADGVAEADVQVIWAMPGKDAPKPERKVAFRARFLRAGSDPVAWLYGGEVWQMHYGDGVTVMHEGTPELAERTARAFQAIRPGVEEEFDLVGSPLSHHTQKVKIYANMKHLQQSITLSYVNPLGGWNEPGESIKTLSSDRTSDVGLRTVLAHEYGHVATFALGPSGTNMEWWILEGMAEWSSEPIARALERQKRTVGRWAAEDKLSPWADLADFEKTPAMLHGRVYTQGFAMAAFMTERYGKAARNGMLRARANGATLEDACREHFAASFEEVHQAFLEWLPKPEPKSEKPAEAPAGKPDDKKDAGT
jgi:hypothetical protein